MAEYVTLLGAEDVQRAGRTISDAADRMQRAADTVIYAVERLERLMDRFESLSAPTEGES